MQDRTRIQERLHHMTASLTQHGRPTTRLPPQQMYQPVSTNNNNNNCTNSFLSMDQMIVCLQHKNCIAIALVDNTIFSHAIPFTTATMAAVSKTITVPNQDHLNNINHTYVGHYIIIVGITSNMHHLQQPASTVSSPLNTTTTNDHDNRHRDVCLVIYNPASISSGRCCDHGNDEKGAQPEYVSISHFEQAWRAYGTDDDIIFISKQS